MNVLVIEDDNRIANLVERALTEDGHSVTVSHNGREGAHLLLSGQFDAALLDILLPEMDGFEVLERVRANRCKTPILVLTAVDAVPKILQTFDLSIGDFFEEGSRVESVFDKLKALSPASQKEVESFIEFKRAQELDGSWESEGGESEGGDD